MIGTTCPVNCFGSLKSFPMQVAAGQPIGTATGSSCANHIHLAFQKDGGSYVDPTKYLESIIPVLPVWKQICDDYKLVFKVNTGIVIHTLNNNYYHSR